MLYLSHGHDENIDRGCITGFIETEPHNLVRDCRQTALVRSDTGDDEPAAKELRLREIK